MRFYTGGRKRERRGKRGEKGVVERVDRERFLK